MANLRLWQTIAPLLNEGLTIAQVASKLELEYKRVEESARRARLRGDYIPMNRDTKRIGKLCKYGHDGGGGSLRYGYGTGNCVECDRIKNENSRTIQNLSKSETA